MALQNPPGRAAKYPTILKLVVVKNLLDYLHILKIDFFHKNLLAVLQSSKILKFITVSKTAIFRPKLDINEQDPDKNARILV